MSERHRIAWRALAPVCLWLTLADPTRAATAWTGKGPQGEWTIVVETNAAPPGAVTNAVGVFFADYPRIGPLLGVAPTAMPRRLEVLFATNLPPNVPAHTAGPRMTVAVAHARHHPGDLRGLLIHEWTHTVQAYPSPDPGWLTEGLADAVRLLLSPPGDPWRRRIEAAPRDQTDYRRGYGEAARFLLWLRDQGRPELLADLNTIMRERRYAESWWADRTGQTLDEWWRRYRESK